MSLLFLSSLADDPLVPLCFLATLILGTALVLRAQPSV
jgi:hypothetical protein